MTEAVWTVPSRLDAGSDDQTCRDDCSGMPGAAVASTSSVNRRLPRRGPAGAARRSAATGSPASVSVSPLVRANRTRLKRRPSSSTSALGPGRAAPGPRGSGPARPPGGRALEASTPPGRPPSYDPSRQGRPRSVRMDGNEPARCLAGNPCLLLGGVRSLRQSGSSRSASSPAAPARTGRPPIANECGASSAKVA
jgi:hypothetical protein